MSRHMIFIVCILGALCPPLLHANPGDSLGATNKKQKTVLIVRKNAPQFEAVQRGIADEIQSDYAINTFLLSAQTSYERFKAVVTTQKPDLLVLMDNRALDFAKSLKAEKDKYCQAVPAVATMGLNLRHILQKEEGICGVEYEVPPFSIVTQYRNKLETNPKVVLVFYRASVHQQLIDDAKAQLAKEGITLRAVNAEEGGKSTRQINWFLKKHVRKEVRRKDVDVVLMLLDNILVNRQTLSSVWLSAAKQSKVPFICGIEAFTRKQLSFAAFASYPDHNELGAQTAQLIFSILEDGEKPHDLGVEYILSVRVALNREILWQKGIKHSHQTP